MKMCRLNVFVIPLRDSIASNCHEGHLLSVSLSYCLATIDLLKFAGGCC